MTWSVRFKRRTNSIFPLVLSFRLGKLHGHLVPMELSFRDTSHPM